MLSLLVCAALSQAPAKVAVVQASNLGVQPKRAAELTGMLIDLMISEKLEPLEANTPCDNRECLVSRAGEVGAPGSVSIAFGALGKDTVMDLECIAAKDGRSLAQTTFTVRMGDAKLPFEATSFVADVRRAFSAAPPKVADAPEVTPKLTPDDPGARPELVGEGVNPSRVAAVLLGVGALAAGALSVVMLVLANNERVALGRHLQADGMHVDIPETQAASMQASANGKYTGSLIGALVAAAFTAGMLGVALY